MRIIAGEFRSRVLLGPEDAATTRPITDRVKQSLFDILTPNLNNAIVYDLFSGTGSMGLEALSRGAAHATFFEADRSALNRLTKNIASLQVVSKTTLKQGDLFKHLTTLAAQRPSPPVTLAFLDPPYRFLREKPQLLQTAAAHLVQILAPGAIVLFRHDAADSLDLAPLKPLELRSWGSMAIQFLTPPPAATS